MAAGFTKAAGGINGLFENVDGPSLGNTIKAAVLGGTASVIGGGKFANGAITGAMSRALNDQGGDVAQKGCGGRPCISRGGAGRATVGEGAQSLFDDLFRVRYHYRALAGEFGLDAKLNALAADATITHALKAYYDGGDLSKIDGLTISVNDSTDLRQVVNSQIGTLMRANQDFVIGRLGAQGMMNYTVGRVSGTGLYGSIGVGSGTFGVATVGRALNLYDQGVTNTVDFLSRTIAGVR